MVYSDTTNKNGLLQMCEQTTGLGDAIITGNAVNKAYFTSLMNQWLQIGHFYAWTNNKDWHFDDSNHTNLAIATTSLVDGQRGYTIPSMLYRLRKVEGMDSAGKYYTIEQMSDDSPVLRSEREQETAGIPTHYWMIGRVLKLYPKPDTAMVTSAAGLRLHFDRKMDLFVVGDTSQEPGFDELLHPICYYGPCWEWGMVKNVPNVAQMCERMLGQWPGIREIADKFYSMRDKNDVPVIGRAKKSYR